MSKTIDSRWPNVCGLLSLFWAKYAQAKSNPFFNPRDNKLCPTLTYWVGPGNETIPYHRLLQLCNACFSFMWLVTNHAHSDMAYAPCNILRNRGDIKNSFCAIFLTLYIRMMTIVMNSVTVNYE